MTRPCLLYFIFSLLVILFSTSFLSLHAQQDSDAIDDPTSKTRPTVGLVLAGGGAKGFTYIGLLKMIHEVGLPIDYIGGTSIGSIIGGFYAAGYHPDSIENMVRSIDWDALLTDQIERKYVAFEEKEFAERFILTLPIKEKSVSISPSLYKGQEINLMLNHYFSPFFLTDDFNNLPTPFVCIATDLFTGDEVELRSGYLPMAIRASMSIPGYFSPIDYQGLYLVDGGIINNFPVKNVKAMGADIIVAGDDQPPLRSTRGEFTSLTGVLEQIVTFNRAEANRIGVELSDIYIPLDTKYGVMDFAEYDSIIVFGERTCRPFYDQLKALADSLNEIEYRPMREFGTKPLDEIKIHDVRIKGFDKMPEAYFENYFKIDKDTLFSLEDIEKNIRLMYGSRFFEQVNYEISPNGGKNDLVIEVKEADPGYLSAGIHYDGDYGASLLINGSFRNLLGNRSKLFTDLVLGENPRLRAFYIIDYGARPGFGINAEVYSFKFNTYDKDVKVNEIDFTKYAGSFFLNYSLRNFYNFRAGFEYEYFRFRQSVNIETLLSTYTDFSSYGNFFINWAADTRNRLYFPSSGFRSEFSMKYVMPLSDWSRDIFTSSVVIHFNYEHNYSFAPRWVMRPGIFIGSTLSSVNEPPPQHWFAFGGMNPKNYVSTAVPFAGVNFIQRFGYHATVLRFHMQYNFYRKLYLTLLTDAGSIAFSLDDALDPENYILGYGARFSYDSFIGPVEFTLMGSNLNSKPLLFINLGFWF